MSIVVNLASPNGPDFVITGAASADLTGQSVSIIGDINGDGFDDILLGAPYDRTNGYHSGASYVIFGRAAGFGTVDLGHLAPTDGFRIIGHSAYDGVGFSVAGAGDINGDGFQDFIVAAPNTGYYRSGTNRAYVIFGHSGAFGTIDVGNLGTAGFRIDGHVHDGFGGFEVASAGDVNGDGFDDVIVGESSYGSYAGAAFVVFGGPGVGNISLTDLTTGNGTRGYAILGAAAHDFAGGSVAGAGDVNGDGFADVIVGAPFNDQGGDGAGAAYVIFGQAAPRATVNLANLSGLIGFTIIGDSAGDGAGRSVSAAGDINGDGFGDIIIGAPLADAGGSDRGNAYVIFGHTGGFGAIDLSNLAPSAGFTIHGAANNDTIGASLSAAGDVNGDGFDDLLIGAPYANRPGASAGAAYLIFGSSGGFGNIDLANLAQSVGVTIHGDTGAQFLGRSVSAGGDINRDGFDDIVIGAPLGTRSGTAAGDVYVVFGGPAAGPTLLAIAPSASRNDFNGDGLSDVLWRSDSGAVTDWLATDNGFFGNSANFLKQVASSWWIAGTGDFDGDGRVDLLWRNSNGLTTDWLAQPNGNFGGNSGNLLAQIDPSWHIAATGDFNGDGLSDILWRTDAGLMTDWLATGNGRFAGNSAAFLTQLDASWQVAGSGDFDGDGIDDILLRNIDGTVTTGLGQTNGRIVANTGNLQTQVSNSWHVIGTGDFNGDGISDILWRHNSGLITDWLGTGNGHFAGNSANLLGQVTSTANAVQIGDFNGDGIDDILWRAQNGSLSDWFGQPDGGFIVNPNFHANIDYGWHVQPHELFV